MVTGKALEFVDVPVTATLAELEAALRALRDELVERGWMDEGTDTP